MCLGCTQSEAKCPSALELKMHSPSKPDVINILPKLLGISKPYPVLPNLLHTDRLTETSLHHIRQPNPATWMYMYACKQNTYLQTHLHTYRYDISIYIHTRTYAYIHIIIHMHICMCPWCMHMHIHVHIHTYIHTYAYIYRYIISNPRSLNPEPLCMSN